MQVSDKLNTHRQYIINFALSIFIILAAWGTSDIWLSHSDSNVGIHTMKFEKGVGFVFRGGYQKYATYINSLGFRNNELPDPVSEDVQGEPELETELDVKLEAIENVIKSQIKNTVQRTTATLNVINEIVSREMISQQPDMSSYFNMNAALFDTRQLPSGNPAFFNQISLDTYDYTIYNDQVAMVTNMVGQDPVVQHEKKMRDINSRKTKVLIELKEMLNARSNE